MSEIIQEQEQEQTTTEVHVKKHDHSILGKHSKKDKEKYLEGLKNESSPDISENKSDSEEKPEKKSKKTHVKKHDHSILGKHTKEDKQKYLEGLK